MKKHICLVVVLTLIFGLFFSSCKKYEEDYGLKLKTPKARLVGTWKMTQIDIDTMSIKMSTYAMFGELYMTFEKDETGSIKFKDNGLGDVMSEMNWEEMLADMQDSSFNAGSMPDMGGVDIATLLSTETKFLWAFDDKKEYIKLSLYDSSESIDLKILSLDKYDSKFRYDDDSVSVSISMQK